jgi:endonuclease/exonuclease/phosphatase (EEP) superfamily protein YafD
MRHRTDFLLRAGLGVISVAIVLGRLGRYDWRFDLLAHWRFHFAVAVLLLLALFLIRRQYGLASIAALAACVNGVLVLDPAAAVAASANAPGQERSMRLRVANANVLYDNKSYDAALGWLQSIEPDLAVLVEVTPEWANAMEPLSRRLPYNITVAREDGEGLALYSRYPFDDSKVLSFGQRRRVAIAASLRIAERKVTVVAAHPSPPGRGGKTRERDVYLNELTALLRSAKGPVILAGDLNTTPWSYSFEDLVQSLDQPRSGFPPTWPSFLGSFGIPIDHLLGRGVEIDALRTGPDIGSDHRPLVADVMLANTNPF